MVKIFNLSIQDRQVISGVLGQPGPQTKFRAPKAICYIEKNPVRKTKSQKEKTK